jgi:hypothetical protein
MKRALIHAAQGRRSGEGEAMNRKRFTLGTLLFLLMVFWGCSSGPTSYVRTDVDFSFVRRAAILPFENLSQDLHAGTRMQSVFMAAVLEKDALALVELGETLNAMGKLRLSPETALTPEQIVALGKELEVDALFMGSVQEYGIERISNGRTYMVTASFSLAETETGSVIWKSQAQENGTSVWRKLFGGGSASLFDVSRSVVDKALETLF